MSATAPPAGAATPEELLTRFGLDAFRPGQREAVAAALAGRDSLVVMPTGGGKSLCYQLPALADVGLVLVVSPLIALMADQRRRLEDAGVRAAMLASGMAEGHNAQALRDIADGSAQLVLAAPERFASRAFREALGRRRVGLFVVDEAHCVAEWGHDFRPDYLRLHSAIGALGRPAVMAATATATPRVAEEIAQRLGLRDWLAVRSGFDRPNLSFDVVGIEGKGSVTRKRALLLGVLADPDASPAIVYCGTRKDAEAVTALLRERGVAAVSYHAGMAPAARAASQEAFMKDEAQVVVATNAFGMGVDKADVRTVVHWALPTSLEAYYQEAGRAGRDGAPARALLLAARYDLGRLIRFNTERDTTVEDVRAFVTRLRSQAGEGVAELGPGELSERERLLLSIAERAGAALLEPGEGGALLVQLTGRGSSRAAAQAIAVARNRGWEAYRAIERFISNGSVCRRRQILDHFGDPSEAAPQGRCCDVCDPAPVPEAALEPARRARRAPSREHRATGARTAAERPLTSPPERIEQDSFARAPFGQDPIEQGPIEQDPIERDPLDEDGFERLRAWRLTRAQDKPAYTVASNATLEAVLRARPMTLDRLLEVKGIGPAFCERHGDSLLAVLGELPASQPAVRSAVQCS